MTDKQTAVVHALRQHEVLRRQRRRPEPQRRFGPPAGALEPDLQRRVHLHAVVQRRSSTRRSATPAGTRGTCRRRPPAPGPCRAPSTPSRSAGPARGSTTSRPASTSRRRPATRATAISGWPTTPTSCPTGSASNTTSRPASTSRRTPTTGSSGAGPAEEGGADHDYLAVFANGVPIEVVTYNSPFVAKNSVSHQSWYIRDNFRVGDKLTFNAGLRVERYHVYLPAQSKEAGQFSQAADYAVQVDLRLARHRATPRAVVCHQREDGGEGGVGTVQLRHPRRHGGHRAAVQPQRPHPAPLSLERPQRRRRSSRARSTRPPGRSGASSGTSSAPIPARARRARCSIPTSSSRPPTSSRSSSNARSWATCRRGSVTSTRPSSTAIRS